MGNLHSVCCSLARLGQSVRIIKSPEGFKECRAIILPGVGAFDPAMKRLHEYGLAPALQMWTDNGRPLLGICLGLQLLFDCSEEGEREGLGIIPGIVRRLPTQLGERVPHMGWAPLSIRQNCPLFNTADSSFWVYFVHSYAADPHDPKTLAAVAPFGHSNIAAIIWHNHIGACQFHPEKSSLAGQEMLRRWIAWLD
ncbi:imidazole glycerol phosphate synthase subunit HisH [cyanobiont of Ornithocercus magnificus]|nr:imidazole glycerol phosphate synthase subunit HisH [cyanobiont of Ornithocercus magnificus]